MGSTHLTIFVIFLLATVFSCMPRPLARRVPDSPIKSTWTNQVKKRKNISEIDGPPADHYFYLGRAYFGLKLWRQAEQAFKKSLADDPTTAAGVHYFLGRTYIGLYQFREAERQLVKALSIEPGLDTKIRKMAYFRLGKVYVRLRNFTAAENQWEELESLDKDLASQLKRLILEGARQTGW